MRTRNYTENTYLFCVGFERYEKEFNTTSQAKEYAKQLKKAKQAKNWVTVMRYGYTESGQTYWDTIVFI